MNPAQDVDRIFDEYNKRIDAIFEKHSAKMHAEIDFAYLKFRAKWRMAPSFVRWMPNNSPFDKLVRFLIGI